MDNGKFFAKQPQTMGRDYAFPSQNRATFLEGRLGTEEMTTMALNFPKFYDQFDSKQNIQKMVNTLSSFTSCIHEMAFIVLKSL